MNVMYPSQSAFPVVVPDDDVHALAIFLSAMNSDNPTVESAWEALRAAVMLVDGEYLPQRVSLIEKNRTAYLRLLTDLEALQKFKRAQKLKDMANSDKYIYRESQSVYKTNNQNNSSIKGFLKKRFGY